MNHPLSRIIIFSLPLCLLLFLQSCEEPGPDIIPNPNATATFEECIRQSFQFSDGIRPDSVLITKIQNALRLARTVDIELQGISAENFQCYSPYALEVHFTTPLDSSRLADSSRTGNPFIDSLLIEYQFYSGQGGFTGGYPEQRYPYVFTTDLYLNLNRLGDLIMVDPEVIYAGYSTVVCTPCPYGTRVSLSILNDAYTFIFSDFRTDRRIDWTVVVSDGEATLVSKTG
ncbi:MAG: hypothetical protein K9N22_07415 [Candidatus Marinimicrobia bacterium]|nr:hypothetical protein [Candidatus Neomarinimicrobiota bacterium]